MVPVLSLEERLIIFHPKSCMYHLFLLFAYDLKDSCVLILEIFYRNVHNLEATTKRCFTTIGDLQNCFYPVVKICGNYQRISFSLKLKVVLKTLLKTELLNFVKN